MEAFALMVQKCIGVSNRHRNLPPHPPWSGYCGWHGVLPYPAWFTHLLYNKESPTCHTLKHPPLDIHASKTFSCNELSPEPASILQRLSKGLYTGLIVPEFSRKRLPYKSRDIVLCWLWGLFKSLTVLGKSHHSEKCFQSPTKHTLVCLHL